MGDKANNRIVQDALPRRTVSGQVARNTVTVHSHQRMHTLHCTKIDVHTSRSKYLLYVVLRMYVHTCWTHV